MAANIFQNGRHWLPRWPPFELKIAHAKFGTRLTSISLELCLVSIDEMGRIHTREQH